MIMTLNSKQIKETIIVNEYSLILDVCYRESTLLRFCLSVNHNTSLRYFVYCIHHVRNNIE